LPPELLLLVQICTKSFVGWGFVPDPLAVLGVGPPGKRKEGWERKGIPKYSNPELASLA